jgi:hypothetical protein
MVQHISTEYLTMDFLFQRTLKYINRDSLVALDMKKQTELNLIPHKLFYKIPISYWFVEQIH